jgi:hypothetical protein
VRWNLLRPETPCGSASRRIGDPALVPVAPPPALNWNRIDDFGYLAQHLMAIESKYVIGRYYGTGAHHSFWNGCSTGGRRGLMEAQRYPTDFNGILAGGPALNWPQFMVAQLWPELVMEWNGDYLSACKEDLVNTTLQDKCPDQDGQIDGVFEPRNCDVLGMLDSLIGTVTPCGTFTATDALVVREIWQGPRLSGSQNDLENGLPVWFGMEPGASLDGFEAAPGVAITFPPGLPGYPAGTTGFGLAVTYQQSDGQWSGAPFVPSADWLEKWIKQDPNWLYTDETYRQYWQDFLKSGQMFDQALATDSADLGSFRAAGGKLIMWQGLADQLIFTGDSITYYNHVLAANGGDRSTESFFRYFLAPGVGHCGAPRPGSIAPTNPMQQVIDWIENGQAPSVLNASGSIDGQPVTRPLCPLPRPGRDLHRRGPDHRRELHLQRQATAHQPVPAARPARTAGTHQCEAAHACRVAMRPPPRADRMRSLRGSTAGPIGPAGGRARARHMCPLEREQQIEDATYAVGEQPD